MTASPPFSAAPVLDRLKDFQRRTVDAVFRRLYLDDPPARRFLVADEVGLGKTMVARGVIARTLEHLQGHVRRIDIVYVCSNAAIAAQNVKRLNVFGASAFQMASRLTLLPREVRGLRDRRVNFISFTPGTTFDLKSRGGTMEERVILQRMLAGEAWLDAKGLVDVLQASAGRESWRALVADRRVEVDAELGEAFRARVRADAPLRERLVELCERFRRGRPSAADEGARYALIGDLRHRLATVCLDALEPDLIILDEFQRFRHLLDGDDPAAELARALFDHQGPDGAARVLLVSATPYRMLSLDHEVEDDHYADFLRTVGFLAGGDDAEVAALEHDVGAFRRALYRGVDGERDAAAGARAAVEERLRRWICRTERVGITRRLDAMLHEPPVSCRLAPEDLGQALLADGVAAAVGAADTVEYWKSSPYLLNFMKHYDLRRRLERHAGAPAAALAGVLRAHEAHLLRRADVDAWADVPAANPRLRALAADTLDRGLWRVLWLPPSLPYWQLGPTYAQAADATKALVFSAWSVVPDLIAGWCSYEAERRTWAESGRDVRYRDRSDGQKPLLRFSRGPDGRLTGMPALAMLYPSPSLAFLADPVAFALEAGGPPPADAVVARLAALLAPALDALGARTDAAGPEDQRWYWAAPALLDARSRPAAVAWAAGKWAAALEDLDLGDGFREHVSLLATAAAGRLDPPLGRAPADLPEVLATMVVASPATAALRSLARLAPDLPRDDAVLLESASRVGVGFRTLFNLPETVSLLRAEGADEDAYWRVALRHGLDGGLAALLDEEAHVLREALGVADVASGERAAAIGASLQEALSIRTVHVHPDEVRADGGSVSLAPFPLRCRFALRFGELRDDGQKTLTRAETVRVAFNSPFRPFVLASTSIGQEGLDFHTWCHAVVHWNLPSNPVDLEQREGRVHRFKGHAVRKNLARAYGVAGLAGRWSPGADPWEALFERARAERPAGASDLVPYWVFETEGGARIERRVPLLPFSRDAARYRRLRRGLALYRLVFGQPRQEDLLAHLADRLPEGAPPEQLEGWRVDLSPRE